MIAAARCRNHPGKERQTILVRYYTYATHTRHSDDTRPPVRHRPPAISLRTNHLFRISGLPQSGLRMRLEYYPSVRFPRGLLHCIPLM